MSEEPEFDPSFDMRSDAGTRKNGKGRDADQYSPTLRRYHQLLWSKTLPNGQVLDLSIANPRIYLHHSSELGQFFLSSDTVIRTFVNHPKVRAVIDQIPEDERIEFSRLGYTIGAMMVFPGNRIERRQTINGARGFHPRISDRMDLTLECIRRHYESGSSPLEGVLARYSDFFDLFVDFRGYVDFFLLQDLVNDDYTAVRFFAPFDDFRSSALPGSVDEYKAYRARTIEFMNARNARMAEYVRGDLQPRVPRT